MIVRFDASMTRAGSTVVSTRRFEALRTGGQPRTVAPAINAAANRVAMEVAQWIERRGPYEGSFGACRSGIEGACPRRGIYLQPNVWNCGRTSGSFAAERRSTRPFTRFILPP